MLIYQLHLVHAGTTAPGKSVGETLMPSATATPNKSTGRLSRSSLTRSHMVLLSAAKHSLPRCCRQWARSVSAPSWNALAKVYICSNPVLDMTPVPMTVKNVWKL